MCLIIDNNAFREFVDKTRPVFDVYKIVRLDYSGKYRTPYQEIEIKLNEPFVADRSPVFRTKYFSDFYRNGVVLEGGAIHCCLSIDNVKEYLKQIANIYNDYRVLKCKADIIHLIAIGQFDSVAYPMSIALSEILPYEDLGQIGNL